MPKVTASSVGLSFTAILRPTVRPLVIAIAATPALFVGNIFSETDLIDWIGVVTSVFCYGMTYMVASWMFMISRRERKAILRLFYTSSV